MALREYLLDGRTYQFDDSDVPAGAVRVPEHVDTSTPADAAPKTKARKPANKARTPENK